MTHSSQMAGLSTDLPSTREWTEEPLDGVEDEGFNFEILNIMAGSLGIVGNSFALVVLIGYIQKRKRVSNSLLVNQCTLDLVASIVTVIYHIALINLGREYRAPYLGLAGDLYCKLWASALWHWCLMIGSSYNLLAITFERYLMIAYPIYHKVHVTRKKLAVIAVFPWVIGIAFQFSYGIPSSELQGETCVTYAVWPNLDAMRAAGVISTFVPFFFPAIVMMAVYVKMIVVLKARVHPGAAVGPLTSTADAGSTRPNTLITRSQRNLTKTCIIIGVAFAGCWSPSQCFWLLYNLGVDLAQRQGYHLVTLLMVYLNCSVNPFIYIFSYKDFQSGMGKMFCKKKTQAVFPSSQIAKSKTTSK